MSFSIFWILHFVVTILLLPIVITQKKRPTSAVAWMLAIVFLPFLGAFLYLLFGTGRIKNKGRQKFYLNVGLRKKHHDIEANWTSDKLPEFKDGLPEELIDIMRISSKVSPFSPVGNNNLEILVDAKRAYQRMKEAILNAKDHINLEYYIFCADKVGAMFRDLLLEKARQGVKVNFLYDAIGSISLGWSLKFLGSFQAPNIKVKEFLPLRTFFKPWNIHLRNHRKILVIDNKVGFTGGINIGECFLEEKPGKKWRDTHIMVEGPAVSQLQAIFCEDWYFATGEDLFTKDYFPHVESTGGYIAQAIPSGPDEIEANQRVFFAAISQAKKSVYLTTPYFIPDRAVFLALQTASMRGVDIRLLLPHESDHGLVLLAGRSYYEDLLKSGVRIFEYMPGMIHAKMLVIDGHFLIIGSTNVDIRSFTDMFEADVQVYSDKLAKIAESVFFADLENSREISPDTFLKRRSYVCFSENVCRLLSPFF